MNRWVWIASVLVFVLFVYLTKGVLLPFIAGLAIAYFLDPVADALEMRKVPRGMAAAIVIALFFFIIIGVLLAFWPVLQSQLAAVAKTLPNTLASFKPWLNQVMANLMDNYGVDFGADADSMLANLSSGLLSQGREAAAGALKGGLAFFNILTLILISPVVAFYLLRDWDLIIAKLDSWLPSKGGNIVREQAKKIDSVLAGFVRGQLLVSTIMGVLYGVGWALTGLDFAIVLGVLAGVMSFVPFVGALFAAIVAVAMAIGQWGFDPMQIALVVGVFFVVQTIESAFLTPRLVGERVGLHPVWVLFAVFAGGEVMGFVGVLVAVPATAAIAVLVRYWIERYLEHYQDKPIISHDSNDDTETETNEIAAPDDSEVLQS
ncbi:AI-2E family transporter [Kordiimonas aquimaris]|uniref:AI-2E family transporter n=1 Tax=Kordiimonas aquimaris TaxID=707591 RepID=UPI0021D0E2F4|nr:AI-2E family transporter [Kordiimonas aquimaris]